MLNIGLIGTGGISWVHLSYLKKQKNVNIAGLCDIKPEALNRRQSEFGGKGFDHFMKLLDGVKLDAVWLCTPPEVREEMLVECAKRGIPVFCEKPVERTLETAEKIAKQLRAKKAKVQVGYVFRSIPLVNLFREASKDDKIYVAQSYYGCDMSLKRDFPEWFFNKDRSGGGLIDQATHNFDLMRYLFGEITEVTGCASNPRTKKKGNYTIDETIGLSFLFKSGMLGTHTHTWVGDTWRNIFIFSGEKRHYRMNMGTLKLTVYEGFNKTTKVKTSGGSMYEHENEIFLEMVRTGDWSKNPCDYDDGLKTLKLMLASDRSTTEGKIKL